MVARARTVTIGLLLLALASLTFASTTGDHLHFSTKAHDCALCQPTRAVEAPSASLSLPSPQEVSQPPAPPVQALLPAEPPRDATQPRAPPA